MAKKQKQYEGRLTPEEVRAFAIRYRGHPDFARFFLHAESLEAELNDFKNPLPKRPYELKPAKKGEGHD